MLVKELASEAYSVEAYVLAKGICELPVSTVLPAAFFMVLWPLVGLPWAALPLAYAVSLLISWTSSSLAVLVSAAVFDESRTMVVMILVLSTFLSARFDLIAALRGSLLLLFDRQSLYSLTQSLCDSTLPFLIIFLTPHSPPPPVFVMCSGGFFLDLTAQPAYISWMRFSSFWYYAMGLSTFLSGRLI